MLAAVGDGAPGEGKAAMNERVATSWPVRAALRSAAFAERWFPDAYVFAVLGVVVVAASALLAGATPQATTAAFGKGFWSLIPFTMQMAFVVIGGYVVATAPVVARLIDRLARIPGSGRGAIAFVATLSMLTSLLSWGFSLVFGGLLVRALARREELRMDYRAAGAAAYLGLGAVWAMGLSSSAAQLQANPASMPPELLAITGVLPFTQTILLWQSLLLTAVLVLVSVIVAATTAPVGDAARTAREFVRDGSSGGGRASAASGNASAVRTASPVGAVKYATASDTAINAAVSTIDCHSRIVCVNGSTPVIASRPGGMLAGLACSCAAEELSPKAHTAPRPR
jgi:hypothetical protein